MTGIRRKGEGNCGLEKERKWVERRQEGGEMREAESGRRK